jgi:FecR protein
MDYRALVTLLLVTISLPIVAAGAGLKDARITAVIREVNLVATNIAPRPAALNDDVRGGTAVQTGADSRAELTFSNQAVARLSANAALTFKARDSLDLTQGAVLIHVPNGAKGKVQAAGVAAALSGVTAVLEYQPPAFKFLVIEGIGRLYRPRHLGDSVLVRAGQMIFGSADAALSDPVDFDIGRFVKTCPLLHEFSPLQNEKLMTAASQKQQRDKSKKTLIETNLVIFGGGTIVSITDPAKTAPVSESDANSAPAVPSPTQSFSPSQTLAGVRR